MDRKHFNDYDLLRVFAILFVVIGHSAYLHIGGGIGAAGGGVDYKLPHDLAPVYNSWIFHIARYISGWVYGFHMPLFFILSGAVFGISANYSFDLLCKKKTKRLVIPYYLYCLAFMLPVKWFSNFYSNTNVNVAYVSSLLGGGKRPSLVSFGLVLGLCSILGHKKSVLWQLGSDASAKPYCTVLS